MFGISIQFWGYSASKSLAPQLDLVLSLLFLNPVTWGSFPWFLSYPMFSIQERTEEQVWTLFFSMCPLSNTCVYIYISAKFTLNSKRFPRLKSTFPLWLNLQSSPRYIQNGFQPSSHFFLDRKPFALVLCLLLGWTFLNYLCRRCSNALGSRGLGMLKKLFRA